MATSKLDAAMTTNKVHTSETAADDPRWARIIARDKHADGLFWYSVLTTGVYCRPSCPSRTGNPKNARLDATRDDTRATGLPPCKRCTSHVQSADRLCAGLSA